MMQDDLIEEWKKYIDAVNSLFEGSNPCIKNIFL
jgi:hypothetical protein